MDNQEQKATVETELSRDLGLTSALAIGVGTMIAAGIFTLSGLAIRNVGSAAIASFVLAAVVALFTALTYCEFISIYPRSGEGYLYARKTFPAPLAYFVGWALVLGYASSCAFYIASLSSYFNEFIYHLPIETLFGVITLIGGAILFFSVTLPLEDLSYFANTVLLIALMLVNAALIVHRRKYPDIERPFRVLFVPLLPALGILANLYLLGQILQHPLPFFLAIAALIVGILGFVAWKGVQTEAEAITAKDSHVALSHGRATDDPNRFRILLPTAGGKHARWSEQYAASIAANFDSQLTICQVIRTPEQEATSKQILAEAEARIRAFQPGIPVDRQLIPAVSVTKGIVSVAADYDTIMLGAAGKGFQPKALFGNIPEIVARDTEQTVIVVKHYNRVKALVGRVLGE